MIWNCFHANGFGPLVLVDGTVDQDKYINILAQIFHPWFVRLCQQDDRGFMLQEDGASCHNWWLCMMVERKLARSGALSTGLHKVLI